jgi:hypothetical protein
MTAAGGVLATGSATLATQALMSSVATGEFVGAAALSALVTFTETDVEILGEDWSIVTEEGETWSEVSEGTEIWTVVSEGSESWNVQ